MGLTALKRPPLLKGSLGKERETRANMKCGHIKH